MSKNHTYAALICKHCNAHLSVDTENPTVTCEYCGATYRTSDLLPSSGMTAQDPETQPEPETDPLGPLGEPARGRSRTPKQKRRLLFIVLILAVLTICCVRCSVNVISDGASSSSTSASSVPVTAPSASSSSSGSSSDAFGGSGATSSSSSSGSFSSSNSSSSMVITPATHSNPNAVTPAFKQQIDEFETALNNCLQKVANGDTSMEPYLELIMILDEMDEIDESSLSAADRAYMRETLVHMASNIPAVMGSGFQLHLGSNLQNVIN